MPEVAHVLMWFPAESRATNQCLAVYSWSLLVFGVALPVFLLRDLGLRARGQHPDDQWPPPFRPLPPAFVLYLACCLLWAGIHVVLPLHS